MYKFVKTMVELEQAIEVHRKTVEKSGGGAIGHLELGKYQLSCGGWEIKIYYMS